MIFFTTIASFCMVAIGDLLFVIDLLTTTILGGPMAFPNNVDLPVPMGFVSWV
jgi:hypothetical protein